MRSLLIILCLVLCSCNKTKDFLGMGEPEPLDEFSVIKTPRLEIPPDFELRPPSDGGKKDKDKPEEKPITSKGEMKLIEKIEEGSSTNYKPTKADENFLEKMGK